MWRAGLGKLGWSALSDARHARLPWAASGTATRTRVECGGDVRRAFLHELLGREATTTANLRYQLLRRFFEFRSGNGLMTVAPDAVTANGQRILINRVVDDSGGEPLAMVINWPALVKR